MKPAIPHRRAAALAGAILVLTVVNLAVVSAVVAGADDITVAGWRADSIRAFLAAESGAHVFITETNAGREPPDDPFTLPGGEAITIGEVVGDEVTVEGNYGAAVRAVTLQFE